HLRCGSARRIELWSSIWRSLASILPAFQGLLNHIRPWRSIARSFGVFRGTPSPRSTVVVVVPLGSKRTIDRPPEQQPYRRPSESKASPLVWLVCSRNTLHCP